MQDLLKYADDLVDWFRNQARPFLTSFQGNRLVELDRDIEKIASIRAITPADFTACFLGNCGVGKSTLINVIVGGITTVVPSGGVGPLTAQALTVRFAKDPRFEVQYHPFRSLWRMVFGLEQSHKAELPAEPGSLFDPADEEASGDESVFIDSEKLPSEASIAQVAYRKMAQLLVTGNQDNHTNVEYLADCLREAGGKARFWGTELRDSDKARVTGISNALEVAKRGETQTFSGSDLSSDFQAELRNHASGYLAPLIRDLRVFWDSELLADGITLVDLPGVGIAGDVYRQITRSWVRTKAEAIVLVVDHRGITEAVAELLRKSEFLNRLLYSADDPTSDPVLMVAVVRVDDIADERFAQNRNKLRRVHFAEVCLETVSLIREQLRAQLESVWTSGDGLGDAQRQVIDNILAKLEVHPLSAIQFRKLLINHEDDRPFIVHEGQSNVPAFREALANIARERRTQRMSRLHTLCAGFSHRVLALLEVIRAQWEEETRASDEATRLRDDLEVFLTPLRKELHVRQGQYRAFLKKNIPQRIRDLIEAAKGKSMAAIHRYLLKLGSAHWATLRASVRYGGRFAGATDIDLPREFALRVEEPIAEVWGKDILNDIRRETKQYAQDCVRLVAQVVAWAKEQGTRVKHKTVEAQFEAIKADASKLESVGREMVAELREQVKNRLIEEVEPPIKKGCRQFVQRNAHVGVGVKIRILGLFAELAETVTQLAAEPATDILTRLFREVETEIWAAFEGHQDPLTAAANAIVASQEDYLKRSDAQKRRQVLDRFAHVLTEWPKLDAAFGDKDTAA